MSTWRDGYRPIIAAIIRETKHMTEPARSRQRRRRFRREYPASTRRGWAYQCRLDEIKRQLGRSRVHQSDDPRAMKRFLVAEAAGQMTLELEG